MPELPEIYVMARDMRKELVGRTFGEVEVLQPKCLNVPVDDFQTALRGTEIRDVTPRGKWVRVELAKGWLLLCLGMGGEILLTDRDHLPEKYSLIFDFRDGASLAVNFWWWCSQLVNAHPQLHIVHPAPFHHLSLIKRL